MTTRSQSANDKPATRTGKTGRANKSSARATDAHTDIGANADDAFARRLLAWFDVSGRHDLPWQHPRTPYRVWLSEIMLQQTQVKTAAPYFERFVAALPSLPALAAAPLDTVLGLWSGLGYYARARNLHAAAKYCAEHHGGDLPRDIDALTALPGIGRSTAAAILAQAWDDRHAILDGNVKRVLSRYHGIDGYPGLPAVERQLWALAQAHLPHARMVDYTQAQMDLGATLCTRADPSCILCPLQNDCVARIQGRVAELPVPKPGKVAPQRYAQVLWLLDRDGCVLLQRRPPAGIWASLWTLPQTDDEAQAARWFAQHIEGEFADGAALAPIAHAFSHYKLELHPRRWNAVALRNAVGDNDDLRWFTRTELAALGIPAPIRRLIEAAA
ncbi:MAG: A/G-specific adenine glycosylase [Lysobacter sp.]